MNIIKGLEVFVAVAEQEGMAPAARALDMSTSAVSRHLQDIEDWAGTQFFRRTTRSLSLTEAGQSQLVKARYILDNLAEFKIGEPGLSQQTPKGALRFTAPDFVIKRLLAPVLVGFQKTYPLVELDILATDRIVDLVTEGFDVSVRIGDLPDSSMKVRKIADVKLILVASPDYTRKNGTPESAADLKQHNCLVDTAPYYKAHWPVVDHTAKRGVAIKGTVQANAGEIVETLALEGLGIALLPDFFVAEHLGDKRLVELLKGAKKPEVGMYLVYPEMRLLPPKVRAFVDHVSQWAAGR